MVGDCANEVKQARSLPHRLRQLQLDGRLAGPPLFEAVPRCGQVAIEAVLDEVCDMKSVVLLGFTRDGGHLVSYTTQPVAAAGGQEGYSLQLWRFHPGERCRRLWSVPLFRTQAYLDSLADEEDFMAADDMLLTVAETPDGSLLVVHGRSADPADAASRDCQLVNHLTLIPGPLHGGAAQLQVAHLEYPTVHPHSPFSPYLFVTQLDSDRDRHGSGSVAIALYSGDTVRYVHAEVARQPAQAAPQLSRPLLAASEATDDEMDSSTSTFPAPDPSRGTTPGLPGAQGSAPQSPAASQHAGGQQPHSRGARLSAARASASPQGPPWPHQQRRQRHLQPQQVVGGSTVNGDVEASSSLVWCETAGRGSWPVANAAGSGGCFSMAAVALAQAPRHLDVEAGICEALRQQRVPPAALVDYAAAPVLACCWAGRDGLLLLTVLRLARPAAESSPHERQPSQPASQPQHRSACVLLHAAADTGAGSVVEWLEPPYPWHHDLSAFLVQQTAFAGVAFEKAPAFFADFMRTRYSLPPLRHRLPLVLTNRSVLGSGQSLQHIVHSWMPLAILGYCHRHTNA